jgi:hypothetical protein
MDMTLCKGACGRKDGFEVGKAIDHDGECRHQLARGHVAVPRKRGEEVLFPGAPR